MSEQITGQRFSQAFPFSLSALFLMLQLLCPLHRAGVPVFSVVVAGQRVALERDVAHYVIVEDVLPA